MSSRDTKLYDVADPWHGERGPAWHNFKADFIAGLASHRDKYASLQQHVHGTDPGGHKPPSAAALAANANALPTIVQHATAGLVAAGAGGVVALQVAQAESVNAFHMRSDDVIQKLRNHIPRKNIRDALDHYVV